MRQFTRFPLMVVSCVTFMDPAFAQSPSPAPSPSDPGVAQFEKLQEFLTFKRNRNAADYSITTPNAIDEAKYVTIGGIEQWITIRGEDRNNPVVLFLHGGPGEATNPYGYAVLRTWLKKFTVVQWDQRGAGRTLGKGGAAQGPTMTIDRMVQDGIELSELLRKTLKQDKLVLVGHSWGSILGVLMAKAKPDLFYAYVGTGQVATDPVTNYSVAYDEVLKAAKRMGDQRALRELKEVGRPPWKNGKGFGVERKWSNLFEHADVFLPATFAFAMTAPGYSLQDVKDWLDGQVMSGAQLIPQESAIDSKTLGGEFHLPVFVIEGAEDYTTPTRLARSFVGSIKAPRKDFVAIEGAGHFAVFMKPDAFLAALVKLVYPLAKQY